MESKRVDVDGNEMHYLTGGDGPPVVLLHGGIVDRASLSWGAVLEPLSEEYTVYAPDLLGYGDSDRPDVEYSTVFHVDVTEAFFDAVGLESPSLVGLSMGGGVGLGIALESPHRVENLVAVGSYGLGTELPNGRLSRFLAAHPTFNELSLALLARSKTLTRASLGNVVYDLDSLDPVVVEELYELLQEPNVGEAFRRWRTAEVTTDGYRTDYREELSGLSVPTCFVHGVEDEVFPLAWARNAAETAPNASLETVENCGHWVPRERPRRFLKAVEAFV